MKQPPEVNYQGNGIHTSMEMSSGMYGNEHPPADSPSLMDWKSSQSEAGICTSSFIPCRLAREREKATMPPLLAFADKVNTNDYLVTG